ncbi:hypothetical protein BBK36DRAFT_3520 [Trichoderma citrinoviride]|uniref:Uncharacterized protein n=1 Tax=Trichoderma citrinoviride TaxID=58853 RepID=A0A2T4BDU7_9HYPO|nr:hypothetical protein BBK36DRAFT_3520 [Trichoderma citrinoviride]PTB67510.1 hypothetical protein BBK36DRAFT_3520 [Trichoderma citrinoviride]
MAAPRQLMRWTPEVHQDILIAVFHNLSLCPEDWAKVMADLKDMGYSFSESALRQHVQKLRKNRDTAGIVAASEPGAATTPRKSATPTPRKRRSAKNNIDDMDDALNLKMEQNEDEEMGSPCERPRKRGKSLLAAQLNVMDDETKLEDEDGY